MKVLHICTQDSGGAGIAARRLHVGLKSIGVESKMLVLHSSSSDGDVVRFVQNNIFRRLWGKLDNRLISSEFNVYKDTRPRGLDIFSDDRTIYDISKNSLVKEADIIHLHWIARMVKYIEFFPKVIDKHIVWTLHDMNPFTGGCHVPRGCTKYKSGCGACPQLGSNDPNDLSRRIFKRKEKAYKGHNIYVVTPSKWLRDCAKKSLLFKNFEISVIPNGAPTTVFTTRDKRFSRDVLNLPQNKTLILFGASYKSKNKGFRYLMQSLKLLKERIDTSKIALVIFGPQYSEDTLSEDMGFSIYSLGYIHDELLLSCVYSAVDVFVIPSLEENFPNTVLESMACGTPVVGFSIGGVSDLVRPGETGLLAKVRDVGELCEKIKWMIDHSKERKQMGLNARKVIEQEYTLEIQAKRYQELYSSLSET